MAQFIQSTMNAIGITVNIETLDIGTVVGKFLSPNYQAVLLDWGFAPSPWRYLPNPNNWKEFTNQTYWGSIQSAVIDTNVTRALQTLKKAEFILADNAVVSVILYSPTYVAYSETDFTGWEPALDNVPQYNPIANPVFAEPVLTSVSPVSVAGSSTSVTTTTVTATVTGSVTTSTSTLTTATSIVTTSTTTLTTSAGAPADYTPLILRVAAVIVIVVVGSALAVRRRPSKVA